jgi:hypothetical protein
MDIRFGDHPSFHRAAAGTALGSAALGLALHPATQMAPLVAGVGGIAIGTALGYGKGVWRIGLAAAACAPLLLIKPHAATLATHTTTLAIAAAITGITVAAFGLRGMRGAIAVMFGAAIALLGMWAALRVGFAEQTYAWPSWAKDVAGASAMGMIGVFAMLPRHLRISLDPVTAAMRRLPSDVDGEVRDLCSRSMAIWTSAKDKLADGDPGKNLVRDGVLKTLEVAARSVDVKAQGATDAELACRMDDLDQRIATATDDEVKSQYRSARSALDDQRRYRDHIKQNRERMIARMHNHVAALEKFQLAAGGLAAVRAASAGATAVKQLEELSADVAASGEALAELELGAPAASGTTAVAATTSTELGSDDTAPAMPAAS